MRTRKISVKARKALAEGNVRLANLLLKGKYCIKGTVMEGQQLGRTLGFPTANLKVNEESPLFLGNGVYAVQVKIDVKVYRGMANIGIRPTFNQHTLTVEVHLFEFSDDIYSKEIKVFFIERIRDEKKFPGLLELKNQITADKTQAEEILSSLNDSDPDTFQIFC